MLCYCRHASIVDIMRKRATFILIIIDVHVDFRKNKSKQMTEQSLMTNKFIQIMNAKTTNFHLDVDDYSFIW